MPTDLGDRIKAYEAVSRHLLTRRMPVIIRVDGRAFHTWCRGLAKPFDLNLIFAMHRAATAVAEDMQGFKACYIQSDEASFLLTDYDEITTECWFGYVTQKLASVSASLMTAAFNEDVVKGHIHTSDGEKRKTSATFDARAFNVPEADVANYFLWRAKDWERNSLSMFARSFFSHKQLLGKSCSDMHEMLHERGENWALLANDLKNGRWFFKYSEVRAIETTARIKPKYEEIAAALAEVMPKEAEDAVS